MHQKRDQYNTLSKHDSIPAVCELSVTTEKMCCRMSV